MEESGGQLGGKSRLSAMLAPTGSIPVGQQFIGRPHGDAQLLGYTRFWEQAIAFNVRTAFVQNF